MSKSDPVIFHYDDVESAPKKSNTPTPDLTLAQVLEMHTTLARHYKEKLRKMKGRTNREKNLLLFWAFINGISILKLWYDRYFY